MPPILTPEQEALVRSKRQSVKPTVYDPNGTSSTSISNDFEAWLIVSAQGTRSKLLDWLNTILSSESNKEFEDLLKETLASETSYLASQLTDVEAQTTSFDAWRADPGVDGWQDVAEIAWLMQELQQGISVNAEKEDLEHLRALKEAVDARHFLSKDSIANRKDRLNAWVTALNSY